MDNWIDAKNHYLSSPEKVKQAIQKLLKYGDGNGHKLSGYEWKLIKKFRQDFKTMALA